MAAPPPDNKNLLWIMIAGAMVLLLAIYIVAGADKPVPPPVPPPAVAPAAPEAPPA